MVWQFLKKLSVNLSYDPTIPLLGIFPREKKAYIRTKTCTQMFITTLFVTAKIWKQSKCLFQMRKMIDDGMSIQWNTTQQSKGIYYSYSNMNEPQNNYS